MTSIFLINKREKKNFISLKVFGSASSSFPWHFPSSDAIESPLLFHPFKSHHYPSHGTWLMAFCLGTSITIQSASSITASPPNHLSILRGTLTCSWRTWTPQGSNEIQQSWTDHHCHKNRNGSEITAGKGWRAALTQKACNSWPCQHRCPHWLDKKHVDSLCLFKESWEKQTVPTRSISGSWSCWSPQLAAVSVFRMSVHC